MIISFLISLFIIILLHELSHAIVAKLCNCGIEEIAIGFGKTIYKKKIRKIIYKINILLIGGYCKLKGELTKTKDKDAFINLPYRKKLLIASAGCVTNTITGIIAIYLGLIFQLFHLYNFGIISLILGLSNWFIPIPCLDGGYALWFPILVKFFGEKKGIKIFEKAVNISFIIVLILNLACIPYLIILFKQGAFK